MQDRNIFKTENVPNTFRVNESYQDSKKKKIIEF